MQDARSKDALEEAHSRWTEAWPLALEAWSRFTRLRPPLICLEADTARREGLTGSFAMIRLEDQSVVISLPDVLRLGLDDFAVEILAHEIGHHILAPATLTDHSRLLARMRWALPTVEHHAPAVANLYTDILVNDRLQRFQELRVAGVYRRLARDTETGALWVVYMRIYEILWATERNALGGGATDDRMEGDALLGARLIRSFARDWLEGSGRFAALMLPYLLEDTFSQKLVSRLLDTQHAGAGGYPEGLVEEDPGEREGAIHPAEDPGLTGGAGDEPGEEDGTAAAPEERPSRPARGQAREPYQLGEILRAAGVELSDHEIAVRYYRERARPYLVPFPHREVPQSAEPIPEGLEPWDIGQPTDDVDWFQTVLQCPQVVPGVTTVTRVWGTAEGSSSEKKPIDLDLYIDSSGSMPDPRVLISYPALAGAILSLSALRAGARVQATLWSGKHQFVSTQGFIREEEAVLRVLTGYLGGGTAFPIHILRDTYASPQELTRPVHILVISDDGVTTMFDKDELGNSGWEISATALARANGGGTLALHLPWEWQGDRVGGELARARDELGWAIHTLASLEDLVEFARDFSRRCYAADLSGPS